MELNVFTQQLEQCYNILSQQFVIIKQLKDLTLGTQNESSAINELNQRLNGLETALENNNLFKHTLKMTIQDRGENNAPYDITYVVYSKSPNQLKLNTLNTEEILCAPCSFYDNNSEETYIGLNIYRIGSYVKLMYYSEIDDIVMYYNILAIQSDTVTNN